MISKLKFKKKIQILNYKICRDFLYIKDLVEVLKKLYLIFQKNLTYIIFHKIKI